MPSLLNISILFLVLIFSSCHSGSDTDSSTKTPAHAAEIEYKPLVIKSGIENGHPAGIRVALATTKESDSSTTYKLMSSYGGMPVGFLIVLPRAGSAKKMSVSYIKSLGPPSDLFVHVLAEEYGQQIDSGVTMTDSIPFICMDLNKLYGTNEPPSAENYIAAQFKLFFDSDTNGDDAELFMNINPGQYFEFAEKDEDYRSHLIRIFSHQREAKKR